MDNKTHAVSTFLRRSASHQLVAFLWRHRRLWSSGAWLCRLPSSREAACVAGTSTQPYPSILRPSCIFIEWFSQQIIIMLIWSVSERKLCVPKIFKIPKSTGFNLKCIELVRLIKPLVIGPQVVALAKTTLCWFELLP